MDTGRAKLPGLPAFQTSDGALSRWVQAVAERLEVREGARGNPAEAVVLQRDLAGLVSTSNYLTAPKTAVMPGDVVIDIGGGLTATLAIDKFADGLKRTKLYQDLMRDLNDPNRFNDLPEQVRSILLKDIAEEAAKRGAAIRHSETILNDGITSLAIKVDEVTAAVEVAASGVREVTYAAATANRATAGKVTQIKSALLGVGTAALEAEYKTIADRQDGLRSQYTLKVQTNGYGGRSIAGFGVAATQNTDGTPASAFIIQADKFAIVGTNDTTGLTNTPDLSKIPFGVDAYGIYMNSNVYIKGNIRVDTSGKTILDGMRGSLQVAVDGVAWSDNVARQAIFTALGLPGITDSNNNKLVIGDAVTISGSGFAQTKHWMGSYWLVPGAIINGSLLVDGSVAAQKIDTYGLTIKNAAGQVIVQSGVGLTASFFAPLDATRGAPSGTYVGNNLAESLVTATAAAYTASADATAKANAAALVPAVIGKTVKFSDGSTLEEIDFVSKLTKIGSGTIDTFIDKLAISNSYIGIASVDTLKIRLNSVSYVTQIAGLSGNLAVHGPSSLFITATCGVETKGNVTIVLKVNGKQVGASGAGAGGNMINLPVAVSGTHYQLTTTNISIELSVSAGEYTKFAGHEISIIEVLR